MNLINKKIQKRLVGFLKFWEEHKPIPIASEVSLYDIDLDYAGTADLVCQIDNEIWLIDYKTGTAHPQQHAIQLSAYKNLFDSIYDFKIDKIACLYLSATWITKPYNFKEYKYCPEMVNMTLDAWRFFNKPTPSIRQDFPVVFKLNNKEKE